MAKGRAVRPRAADETFGQLLARRYLRADFRGGEILVPEPTRGSLTKLNDYLASSGTARWFERWFWSAVLLGCCVGLFFVGLALAGADMPFAGSVLLAAFGLLLLVFTAHLQAGVRCMFRLRRAARRRR